jgi:hypothetical protein
MHEKQYQHPLDAVITDWSNRLMKYTRWNACLIAACVECPSLQQ